MEFRGRGGDGSVPYLYYDNGTGVYPLVDTHGPQYLTLMLYYHANYMSVNLKINKNEKFVLDEL